ncbi:hypothetical protein [Demequina globuliformis]|uniref:hypothetical protein n=1 Tax=Demequina globuliformis TaxID=676202 RepID=UPI00128BCD68|nr:hypothetical protein [Demequina globuliformis]
MTTAAYTPDGDALTVSSTSATAGDTVVMSVVGEPGVVATLMVDLPNTESAASIAGQSALDKTIASDGSATYRVTFPRDWSGTAAVSAYLNGALVDTQSIAVRPAAVAGETASPLPGTGARDLTAIIGASAAILVAGVVTVVIVVNSRRAGAGR